MGAAGVSAGGVGVARRVGWSGLDGVEAEVGVMPLLKGLKGGWDGAEVGPVDFLKSGDGLGMVLRRRATHQGEAGKGDRNIDDRVAR